MNNHYRTFNDKFKRIVERVAENIRTQQQRSNTIGRNRPTITNRIVRKNPVSTVFIETDEEEGDEEESNN